MLSPACMPWPHAIMPFHHNIRSTDIHAPFECPQRLICHHPMPCLMLLRPYLWRNRARQEHSSGGIPQ